MSDMDLTDLTPAGLVDAICAAFESGKLERLTQLRNEMERRKAAAKLLTEKLAELDSLCDSLIERTQNGDMIIISGSRVKRLDVLHWDVTISHNNSRTDIQRAIAEACTLPQSRPKYDPANPD